MSYAFFGGTALVLALLFYAADLLCLLRARLRAAYCLLTAAGSLTIFASSLFTYFFMSDSLALKAVYEHSSTSLPPLLKLSASWTGSGGSLLLWLTMMTIATLAFRLSKRHSMNNERVPGLLMSFFAMAVLAFTLLADPFRQLGIPVPDGSGQSPSLRTFWSVLHPPFVFAAYTTILLSYAIILGRRLTPKEEPHSGDDRIF